MLRQILEDFDSNPTESQASDKYVTATEIKEEAELFLPATFNRAKFEKDLDRYIDSIAGFGFLVEAKHIEGEKRYKIHRIIKDKVTLDDILEFKTNLMTIMQQMNLFNTSSEVAGFKLDYLEVWNWGTFDKKCTI